MGERDRSVRVVRMGGSASKDGVAPDWALAAQTEAPVLGRTTVSDVKTCIIVSVLRKVMRSKMVREKHEGSKQRLKSMASTKGNGPLHPALVPSSYTRPVGTIGPTELFCS
eukprot:6187701-Pleurochrysis_carterae.AAC.1